jgi:hypothetical protein
MAPDTQCIPATPDKYERCLCSRLFTCMQLFTAPTDWSLFYGDFDLFLCTNWILLCLNCCHKQAVSVSIFSTFFWQKYCDKIITSETIFAGRNSVQVHGHHHPQPELHDEGRPSLSGDILMLDLKKLLKLFYSNKGTQIKFQRTQLKFTYD